MCSVLYMPVCTYQNKGNHRIACQRFCEVQHSLMKLVQIYMPFLTILVQYHKFTIKVGVSRDRTHWEQNTTPIRTCLHPPTPTPHTHAVLCSTFESTVNFHISHSSKQSWTCIVGENTVYVRIYTVHNVLS